MKRVVSLAFLAALPAVLSARPSLAQWGATEEEDVVESARKLVQRNRDRAKERQKQLEREYEENKKETEEKLDKRRRELERRKTEDAVSGDVEVTAEEPGALADVLDNPPADARSYPDPEDPDQLKYFNRLEHVKWSIKLDDFRIVARPARVLIDKPIGALYPAHDRDPITGAETIRFRDVFFAIPFTVKNSEDREVIMAPRMWLISENMRVTPETGGFIAKKVVERSMFRELSTTFDLLGYVKKNPEGAKETVQALGPGEMRHGVAIFPQPNPEFDRLTLVVDGLSNAYRFSRKMKRVLKAEFARPGDEFYPDKETIEFLGKDWAWLWMWYEEISTGPVEAFEVESPSGAEAAPRRLWACQLTISNHSGEPQKIAIQKIGAVVRMVVLGVEDVEVKLADDGKSTIYKGQVMRKMAQPVQGQRFFSGGLDPDQSKVFLAIFDPQDVDWEAVHRQVEAGLTGDISIGYGREPLKPGIESFVPDLEKLRSVKRVTLTEDQKAQVREEVGAQVRKAMEREQAGKRLTANVTAASGLATGTYRIIRSYFRDGVIEPGWIHKWEAGE